MTGSNVSAFAIPLALLASCAIASDNDSLWQLGSDEEITWETVHVLSQMSTDAVTDENGSGGAQPRLSLRCTAGDATTMELRIDWQRFISSFNTEAGFQIDGGKRDWIDFRVDESNRITIARRASDVAALLGQLEQGGRLNVEIIPYSESAIDVSFDLGGFAAGLDALRGACR